ncbi:MAG: amidohydrolase family protein [Promethearchaeota archaeon]
MDKIPNQNIIDAHVHGFPDRLFDAIWTYFEKNYWKIHKKYYFEEMVPFLSQQSVKYFTLLNYAHRSNISRELNDWTYKMTQKYSNIIAMGTIHPQDTYFAEELERILSPNELNLHGIKLQLMVTDFAPTVPELDLMYETLIKYNKILVLHAGTGPITDILLNKNLHLSPNVGINHLLPVLERFPKLKLQIPHLGCMESRSFFDLVKDYPQIHFDTSMALELMGDEDEGGFSSNLDFSYDLIEEFQNNIMFGSDFPNIPHPYSKSITGVENLPVGNDIKQKIFSGNAKRFYNIK